MSESFEQRLKKIKLVITDVDGVLTDCGVYISENMEFKKFCPADGLGMALLRAAGINIAWITGRYSPATTVRAKELGFEKFLYHTPKKIEAYRDLKKRFKCNNEEIAYIGDDLIDLPAMKHAGIKIAPANAREEIKKIADFITPNVGGNYAFRDAADWILKSRGEFDLAYKKVAKENYGDDS